MTPHPCSPVDPGDASVAQEDLVGGELGNPGDEADHDVLAVFTQRSQRDLADLATDRIVDQIDAAAIGTVVEGGGELLRGVLDVCGIQRRVVDGRHRPSRASASARFSGVDAAGDHSQSEGCADVDRRQSHTAAGAEHEHRVPSGGMCAPTRSAYQPVM